MDVVMNVVDQIKTNGKATHGWLGVQIQDVTRKLAESFGMKNPQGALVARIVPDSPASHADIQIGDIITEFNGQPVQTSGDLPPMVGVTPINKEATLKIIRQGETKTVTFKVGLLPDQDKKAVKTKAEVKPSNKLGVKISDLTAEEREATQVPKGGVIVREAEKGVAKDAGISRGDVILRIQNEAINSVDDFEKAIKKLPADKSIAVLIQHRGSPAFLALKLNK
jgi:serine protease Do